MKSSLWTFTARQFARVHSVAVDQLISSTHSLSPSLVIIGYHGLISTGGRLAVQCSLSCESMLSPHTRTHWQQLRPIHTQYCTQWNSTIARDDEWFAQCPHDACLHYTVTAIIVFELLCSSAHSPLHGIVYFPHHAGSRICSAVSSGQGNSSKVRMEAMHGINSLYQPLPVQIQTLNFTTCQLCGQDALQMILSHFDPHAISLRYLRSLARLFQ